MQMLENSCSKYPAYEGRFLLISGVRYTFDAQLPPGSRVIKDSVNICNGPLDPTKEYKVAMHAYTAKGGDGFNAV
jgi:5'-nucleotidase